MAFRISGLIHSSQQFQQEMSEICSSRKIKDDEISFSNPRIIHLYESILKALREIELLCQKHNASPADLPNPSYLIYQWLHFLSKKKWLLIHLYALAELQDIVFEQRNKSILLIHPDNIHFEIKIFNYLFRCKQKRQTITLEINESFISSPRSIKELLVRSTIGGKSHTKNKMLKEFTKGPEFKKISRLIQAENKNNLITYQGLFFNLEEIFQTINRRYFEGKLDRPRLNWSSRHSKRRLGYYHPDSDQITISRSLDSKAVQPLLIEYILYHEMLHNFMGIRETNSRRYAHTGEFKKKEKSFINYQEAIKLMHQFCE
jgi:hypothetical protein